jgi:hypothetical protein
VQLLEFLACLDGSPRFCDCGYIVSDSRRAVLRSLSGIGHAQSVFGGTFIVCGILNSWPPNHPTARRINPT